MRQIVYRRIDFQLSSQLTYKLLTQLRRNLRHELIFLLYYQLKLNLIKDIELRSREILYDFNK